MTKKDNFLVGVTGLIVLATLIGTFAVRTIGAQIPVVTRTEILKADLAGMPGFEGVMYVTTVGPGGFAPRHWHPGYEFNYVLEGAVTFASDGEAPVTLKAGEATFNPRGHVHKVSNASTTEPAKVVVVLIHEKGKPLVVPIQ